MVGVMAAGTIGVVFKTGAATVAYFSGGARSALGSGVMCMAMMLLAGSARRDGTAKSSCFEGVVKSNFLVAAASPADSPRSLGRLPDEYVTGVWAFHAGVSAFGAFTSSIAGVDVVSSVLLVVRTTRGDAAGRGAGAGLGAGAVGATGASSLSVAGIFVSRRLRKEANCALMLGKSYESGTGVMSDVACGDVAASVEVAANAVDVAP